MKALISSPPGSTATTPSGCFCTPAETWLFKHGELDGALAAVMAAPQRTAA